MELQYQFDRNMYCELCNKYVRLVPILYTGLLYDPQFTLDHIIKMITKYWKFHVCPMCCATVCSTAKLCTEEYSGRYECYICSEKGFTPLAYLDNYDNPLFRSRTDHIVYLRYIHVKCWKFIKRVHRIYNIIKGNDWSNVRHVLFSKDVTAAACATIIFPITIPRPFGNTFKPKIEAPKLQIDITKIEALMKNIKP